MRVDVVTAVHAAYARFLPSAWASLRDQIHPHWTWFVQVDGPGAPVLEMLSRCGAAQQARVRVAMNGTHEGPATTRNIALGRAGAPLVHNLDADDELEPAALSLLVGALQADAAAGFAIGQVRDLLAAGELREHPLPVRPGVVARGALVATWTTGADGYRLPVHPAGIMWRRALLLSVGGWSALHGMEDTGLLMAASAISAGVLLDAPTLRYRRHPDQRSAQKSKFAGGGAQIALVRQRASVLGAGPAWPNRRVVGPAALPCPQDRG